MHNAFPNDLAANLSADERRSLRVVVGQMIPASARHGVPGADDESIFADIVASLGRETESVREALRMLDEIAGGVLGDQAATHQSNAIAQFRATESPPMTALVNATVRCYYRDDRVMRSLGMEPRPPFPKGFDIPQGDWSLLDPVRARGRVYREL